MKRPENLYDKDGKMIKVYSQLQCVVDPHTSGTEKLGIQVCSFKGDNFLCEDAALFKLPLSYSVVVSGSENALVFRIKTSEALEIWPPEC